MANQKFSDFLLLSSPSAQFYIVGYDPGTDATKNYRLSRAELMALLEVMPLKQVPVAAAATLPLTVAAHNGATIVLGGAGATVSMNATTVGDGFTCRIINKTGSDWTVPTFTGATNEFEMTGHTKISAGGSASIETYTLNSVRYARISGTTA